MGDFWSDNGFTAANGYAVISTGGGSGFAVKTDQPTASLPVDLKPPTMTSSATVVQAQVVNSNGQTAVVMPTSTGGSKSVSTVPSSSAYSFLPPNTGGLPSVVPPVANNATTPNQVLPSTGGVGGAIDKVAPVFALLVLVKIIGGLFGR